ncbi:MAG: MOSC domain-containing protein [Actinomycetota bacterium]
MEHRTTDELNAALPQIEAAPADAGTLELIVRRPAIDEREVLDVAELDLVDGLVGDTWKNRGSTRTEDGSSHPDMQLNVMSSRVVDLIAGSRERWPLAGDQLYVDLDISDANLPAGTRLHLGQAVIEVTDQPHNGCAKFTRRFGLDAHRWVNSPEGKKLHLRGINAKVVVPGTIRAGDAITVERRESGSGAEG